MLGFCYSRRMAKPRIVIVGAGNLGTALAVSLQRAGYPIVAVVGRPGSFFRRVRKVAKEVGAFAAGLVDIDASEIQADLVWFCVPDSAIASVAQALAARFTWKGKVALHSSGALTSDELKVLRHRGAGCASVHPLMTFVPGSRPSLAGVPFAIEGDAAATRVAHRIVRDLGGQAYTIRKQHKVAYHAWGTFSSPLLTALLATTEQVAALAGVKRRDVAPRMIPILLQTLANYAQFGAAGAFSGPIIRGDIETVREHLRVLRGVPGAHEVYSALARAAIQFLPGKKKRALKQLLRGSED